MNTVELICQESQALPENLRIEVIDFIFYLKSRYRIIEAESTQTKNKINELEEVFSPFRRSFDGFKFNRDEANER